MKRLLCLLLALLLLVLSACRREEAPAPQQPFSFYYRAAHTDYESETGPLGMETRDLGERPLSMTELFTLYLAGPADASLVTPFPRGLELQSATLVGATLTLRLSGEYASLQGVDASIADACIVRTALGLTNIRSVRIVSEQDGEVLRSVTLDGSDVLLVDRQVDTDTQELTFYFADAEGRYLLSEKRTVPAMPEAKLAQYLVEQLLLGPRSNGLYPTMPEGAVLLDINVEGGVCAVDLSAEFLQSRGPDDPAPHLTLLSLANTLSALDNVDQLQLYVEGSAEGAFSVFSLNTPWFAENRAVGPVHPELREFDGTLCLPVGEDGLLYPLTLCVRYASSETQPEALLRTLLGFTPQNGLSNPLNGLPMPTQLRVENGVCELRLPADAFDALDKPARETAQRILTASLCQLPEIDRVRIFVGDAAQQLPETPAPSWFAIPPL